MDLGPKLKAFNKAWKDLSDEWADSDYEFTEEYPFEGSFDELYFEVNRWIKECLIEIYKKKQNEQN